MKNRLALVLTLLAAGAWATTAHADAVIYSIHVNTSSLAGNYGYIDMELNQGTFSSPAVSATVADFTTDGTLNPADPSNYASPTVTGSLPGTLSIVADTSTDYFAGLTFGDYLNLNVTLAGPGVSLAGTAGGTSGTLFQLSFFDSTGSIPLLSGDPSGINVQVSIDQNGIPTPSSLDPSSTISLVPEPASLSLLALGASALLARRKKLAA